MEGELKENDKKDQPIPEGLDLTKATDMEAVSFFSFHIDNPCEAEVSPGEMKNIRDFYIREAEKTLEKMTNPFAIQILEDKIREYKEK